MANPREILANIYAAFGRGDIPAILDALSPDVQWEAWANHSAQNAGVTYLKRLHGRAEVIQFFQVLGGFKFHKFEVKSITADDERAIGEIELHLELPNGVHVKDEELHFFWFNESGQITKFRHYLDTAKVIETARQAGLIPA